MFSQFILENRPFRFWPFSSWNQGQTFGRIHLPTGSVPLFFLPTFGKFSGRGPSLSIWRPSARRWAVSDISRLPCSPQMVEIIHWLIDGLGFDLGNWIDWLLGDASCADSWGPAFSCGTWVAFLLSYISFPSCSTWKSFLAIWKVTKGKSWCVTLYPLHSDFDCWLKFAWTHQWWWGPWNALCSHDLCHTFP